MGWRKTLTPLLAHCVSKTILYLSDKHYIIFYVKSCVNCLTFCIICVTCQPCHISWAVHCHDGVIKWKHFPRNLTFARGRLVTRSLDVFFDLRLDKRLSKQPWGWWYETQSWLLWRHCNEVPVLSTKTWSSLCTGHAFYNTERRHVTKNNIGLIAMENVGILTKSMAAPEVVKMTISSAANDEKVVKMTFPCQWSTALTVTYFFFQTYLAIWKNPYGITFSNEWCHSKWCTSS